MSENQQGNSTTTYVHSSSTNEIQNNSSEYNKETLPVHYIRKKSNSLQLQPLQTLLLNSNVSGNASNTTDKISDNISTTRKSSILIQSKSRSSSIDSSVSYSRKRSVSFTLDYVQDNDSITDKSNSSFIKQKNNSKSSQKTLNIGNTTVDVGDEDNDPKTKEYVNNQGKLSENQNKQLPNIPKDEITFDNINEPTYHITENNNDLHECENITKTNEGLNIFKLKNNCERMFENVSNCLTVESCINQSTNNCIKEPISQHLTLNKPIIKHKRDSLNSRNITTEVNRLDRNLNRAGKILLQDIMTGASEELNPCSIQPSVSVVEEYVHRKEHRRANKSIECIKHSDLQCKESISRRRSQSKEEPHSVSVDNTDETYISNSIKDDLAAVKDTSKESQVKVYY